MNNIRQDFPLLINYPELIYLDNSATTQKPDSVIKSVIDYYSNFNANPHRGIYRLSNESTKLYEESRKKVAEFINAKYPEEIVFTKSATESLNLIAYSYGLDNLKKGDEIVISVSEHHSNLVIWQRIAELTGAKLKYILLNSDKSLSEKSINEDITEKTKIVSLTQLSNVLGIDNSESIRQISNKIHSNKGILIVDGTQSIVHIPVDVQELGVDFFVFSGHKMLASTGIGVLYGKKDILDRMNPLILGGGSVDKAFYFDSIFNEIPYRFESGSPNVAGAVSLSSAIEYIRNIGFERIQALERELVRYSIKELKKLDFIELYGCDCDLKNKLGIISFNIKGVNPYDVAIILDSMNIAIRAGHHCCQPLLRYLKIELCCRISFCIYNSKKEIDILIDSLKRIKEILI